MLRKANVTPEQVRGIGMDFTACTLLPVDADGIPLCCKPEWEHEKHAYVKLWKHHAAQKEFHGLCRVQQTGQIQKSMYRRVIAPQPFPVHGRVIGAHGGQQRLLQRGGQGQIPVVPFRPKAAPQAAQKRLRRAQIVPVGQQQLSVVDE